MASSSSQVESDELARFREEWKNEVKQKHQQTTQSNAPTSETSTGAIEAIKGPETTKHKAKRPSSDLSKTSGRLLQRADSAGADATEHLARRIPTRNAVDISLSHNQMEAIALYRDAVIAEQQGDYEAALHLYQRSFRMESHVDRIYNQVAMLEESKARSNTIPATKQGAVHHHRRPSVVAPAGAHSESVALVPDSLAEILVSFTSQPLHFLTEDERQGVPIDQLPDELIVLILTNFADRGDVQSVERFGTVCRKARLVSLDPVIWRHIVQRTYVPPQVEDLVITRDLSKLYEEDWRHMYINHPRVRLDGVYIAVCHYVRHGHNENPWVTVSHLITYHRFLRFMPDGTVLSLLANNERPPSQVVHTLKPTLKTKGFYIGTWRLEDSTVIIEDLLDSEGSFTRYGFEMTLDLKSKPHGRWNKLSFMTYNSVQLETGEREPLVLKHERPFWFSKVKSYKP